MQSHNQRNRTQPRRNLPTKVVKLLTFGTFGAITKILKRINSPTRVLDTARSTLRRAILGSVWM